MSLLRRLSERIDTTDGTAHRLLKGYTGLVYFFLYAPVLVVMMLSFTDRRSPEFPIEGVSLRWYRELLPPEIPVVGISPGWWTDLAGETYNAELIGALVTSLQVGVTSALLAGVVGTLAALGMVRNEFHSRLLSVQTLNVVFLTPIVVPWIVTGIAVLTLYNLINIQGTFLSLVLGHVLITLPFVVVVVAAQLHQFDRSLEEAAKNLGASELRTFYEVTLPLISPGIVAGMLFAFTISFDNFTQTFFWVGSGTQTLPIEIFSMIRYGLDPTVNAIGTVIVAFSMCLALLAERLSQRVIDR